VSSSEAIASELPPPGIVLPSAEEAIRPVLKASPVALARARLLYDVARRRTEALGVDAFSDPAWHMLLDLFLTESGGGRLSVTALCIGSRSSTTTALRYVGLLQGAGLIVRCRDSTDARRSYVRLTEAAWQSLNRLLDPAAHPEDSLCEP
jgi:DNA-binding MarR family transcriptional regulator